MSTTKAKLIEQYELTIFGCKEKRSHLKEGEHAIVKDAKGENAGGGGFIGKLCFLCGLCMQCELWSTIHTAFFMHLLVLCQHPYVIG